MKKGERKPSADYSGEAMRRWPGGGLLVRGGEESKQSPVRSLKTGS